MVGIIELLSYIKNNGKKRSALGFHMNKLVGSIPTLTTNFNLRNIMSRYDKKNEKLVSAWNATEDIQVRREIEGMLVEYNKHFLYRVCSTYPHEIDEIDELFNEASHSVIKALTDYDETQGAAKFISFWAWKMRGALGNYMYWKEKYSTEINDNRIKGKHWASDGNYGVLIDQPHHDKAYEDGVEKIIRGVALSERERRVVLNFYNQRLSEEQIAQMEYCSKQNISLILLGARKKIKAEITRKDKWKKYSLQYS